ncbi:MAG: ShlB/FhaC/HecB family hemolysin secretion/activation protein, partial [Burkholderiaceae bacterium]
MKVNLVRMINSRVVVLPFLLSTGVYDIAFAQTPPSAGSLNQQIEREQPPRATQKAAPEIRIQQGNAPAAPVSNQLKVRVNNLRVTNSHVFSEHELIAVTGFKPESELTLADLRGMAAKITEYYHQHGYFLAQAYLPAQDIKDGAVTISLLEGQYGKVSLRNQSNLSDALANGLLGGLNNSEVVTIGPLENRLLLLSDIPGVNVKSTLVPGASVGTSDLIVDVTPGQRVTGSADIDNQGSRYTGTNRLGGTLNINDPSGHGDILTLRALTSTDGLNYGRASYQAQFGRAKAGVAYSNMGYRLGKEFASLQANGTAEITSIYGSYPLIRSRNSNLYAVLDFDAKTFRDKVTIYCVETRLPARLAPRPSSLRPHNLRSRQLVNF